MLNQNILNALKLAYDKGEITYEQIPIIYREKITKNN